MCAGPVKNVIDDVSGKTAAERRARKEQKRAEKEAKRRQQELDRLAAEREAAAAQQKAQLAAMQDAQDQKMQAQAAKQEMLEREHAARMEQLKKEGTAATATARSLQVLAMKKQNKAPTATQTKAVKGTRGAKTTNVGLRMGSSSRGTGSGANLSV
jgi:hypothetical protein